MSTTEVGRLPAAGKHDSTHRDGVSLQAVIESERRLDELSCARLVGNIAEAVHAAQKAGQPLGTVTPASVVVLPDGSARLAAGAAAVRYTAPERLRGGAGDRRTDVFTLGVVLWEALAHERLFDGRDDEAIKQAVLAAAYRPPSELNANVPSELDAICKRALARDPADRYQSAHVMAAEIDAVLGDAGYPDSSQQIAAYLARVFGASEPSARPAAPAAPAPAVQTAPTAPTSVTAPVATVPTVPTAPPASPPIVPAAPTAKAVPLPSIVQPAADTGSAPHGERSTSRSGTLPPPALKPATRAPLAPASSGGSGPVAAPAPATSLPAAAPAASPSSKSPPIAPAISSGTMPAQTAPFGSRALSLDPPTIVEPAFKPIALPAAPAPAPAPGGSRFARTEILGSAVAAPAPPAPAPSTLSTPPSSAAGPHPALPLSRLEAPPMQAQIAVESKLPPPHGAVESKLPPPFKPAAHPQPPRSIANAETIVTPQLPAHLGVQPVAPQLGMPPGITVPPSSPPAQLQATEGSGGFDTEPNADPTDVVALPHSDPGASGAREGRDVLAGWGWSTGSVQALDDDYADDALRRGRRNLMIAIAGALGVVLIITVVAFAFSGSKKPDGKGEHGALTPTAPVAVTASQEAAPSPSQPPPSPPLTAEPAPASAEAPKTEPPGPGAVVPPTFDSVKPEPVAEPPKTDGKTDAKGDPKNADAKTDAAKPEPWKAEAAKAEPKKAEPKKAEPLRAEPARTEPPKPEPARAEPKTVAKAFKAEPPRAEPARTVEKKVPEPKKPPQITKRPPAPEKIAKAQPVDPYAMPAERPRADPAALYRTGLQQYAHGDTAGALATFRGSLQTNPGFAPTWRGIGLVHEKMGNKKEARAAFRRYLELAPTAGD
ncbi:MAG TPA: tetratricopeptide repeat protein, partial [Kofleriaceae bacterium]